MITSNKKESTTADETGSNTVQPDATRLDGHVRSDAVNEVLSCLQFTIGERLTTYAVTGRS